MIFFEKEKNKLLKDTIEFLNKKNSHITFSNEDLLFFEKEIKSFFSPKKNSLKTNTPKKNPLPIPPQKQKNLSIPSFKKPLNTPPLPTPAKIKTSLKKPSFKNIQKDDIVKEDFITLEKPIKAASSFYEVKKIILKNSSNLKILENTLDDKIAREIETSWKIKNKKINIAILSFEETSKKFLLLKNLSSAINTYFPNTKLVSALELENENKWNTFLSLNTLKLIIACDYSIWSLKNLIKHYREIPSTKEIFLKQTPLFMLPDLSLYLKEPILKKSLWISILKKIKNL
jgi:hypothetical protein